MAAHPQGMSSNSISTSMNRTVTTSVQGIMTKCEVFWQSTSLFFCGFLLRHIFTLRSPWGGKSHFQVSKKI